MRYAAAVCLAVSLTLPAGLSAQTLAPAPSAPVTAAATQPARTSTNFWAPFTHIPDDLVRFVSADTLKILAIGGVGAATAHRWDGKGIEEAQEHLRPGLFRTGNIAGGVFVQTGAAFGLYSVATLAGSDRFAAVGADLVRSQALSQAIVQAGKFATRRSRPDGSNTHSLPSGHTASAFATATVLQRHFGWRVGVPAYGFGAYVAASRMSANKHHLSDVLLGAAIGVAAGRTVTIGGGGARFDVGVAPTAGGAAITFTKR
jgi:membrane-associated phospholipid phosphatase